MTSTCRNSLFAAALLLAACDNAATTALPAYPDMDSPGFQVFSRYCADCHRPPMPARHDAAGWDRVLRRMQQHRVDRGLGAVPDADLAVIRAYLHAHAGEEGGA